MAYSPAGMLSTSAGLSHIHTVLYRKKALDRLQTKFVFGDVCQDDTLEKNSGQVVQWYRYNNLSASTTVKSEGTVGTSLTYSSNIIQASVSQYADFITVSDLNMATSIAPELQNAAELLGERGGLSVDTMTRKVIDAEHGQVAWTMVSPDSYLKVQDIRGMAKSLQAVNVQPFDDGEFLCIVHPFVSYDLINDPAAGGLADIFKHTSPEKGALVSAEDRGVVCHVAGTKVIESTNVANPSTGVYRGYFFGKGGIGKVGLAGKAPSNVKDPKKQRFNVAVRTLGEVSAADPEGVIGGLTSYNFVFVPVVLEGPAGIGGTYRFKSFNPESSIG
jgi:N4-gp56 family major capsid protein